MKTLRFVMGGDLMLLRQIQYFVTIVDTGSFTEAAERLYVSQSAVSQAIQALEKDLDTQLMIRQGRTFSLSPAGELLYRRGKTLLTQTEELRKEVIRVGKREEGTLSIGYLNLYAGPELTEAMIEFSALYPEITISATSGTHEALYRGLTGGTIDLAMNDQRRAFSADYENVELHNAECMIEISEWLLPAGLERLDVKDLPAVPCILISGETDRGNEEDYYRNILGVTGDFLFAGTMEEARLLVAGSRGFLVIEAMGTLPPTPGGICRVPLYRGKRRLTRKYCLFWRKERGNYYIEEFAGRLTEKLTG